MNQQSEMNLPDMSQSRAGGAPSASSGRALRERAEAALREKSAQAAENTAALSPEAIRRMVHELRVHQIELEMQNEELRRTQAELEVSRSRYFELYDLAPVGYCTLSENGRILEANLAAATLLGVVRGALAAQRISRFILGEDQDRFYFLLKQLVDTGQEQQCELRMLKLDGATFWAHMVAISTRQADAPAALRLVLSDITGRKLAEQKLADSVAEKEVLLREIHHRVKNNLQMMSALLELQAGYVTDEQARGYFKDSQRRIQAMAMLHEQIYENQDIRAIDPAVYLRSLVENLRAQYGDCSARVNIRVEAEDCTLPVDAAIACGLVITELVSNAMKHAFPQERSGELLVALRRGGAGKVVLEVTDNGVGLPQGLDLRRSRSFGMQLVMLIVEKQLHGKLSIESNQGTRVVCEIGVTK